MNETFLPSAPVKPMINVGAGYDIPTGEFLPGINGESVLNGGLGFLTGWTGIGNNFKTTNMNHQQGTAMARMGGGSIAQTYDTESNVHENRVRKIVLAIEDFFGEDVITNGRWRMTDKDVVMGEKWYDKYRELITQKKKNKDKLSRATPFIDRSGKALMIIYPTFTIIDSMSYFETSNVTKMSEENELGDSGANMIFMKQGIAKKRLLMECPALTSGGSDYMQMSCHLGDRFMEDARAIPKKELQFLPTDVELKGVPKDFTYNLVNFWMCRNASPLRTEDSAKTPLYPRDSDDDLKGDTDLFSVTVQQLRSKSGPAGIMLTVIVSQIEGVLPSLTEFHHIKTRERFGLEGNNIHYSVVLCPDVKLQRTTVRNKLDNNPKLRRAVNILSEIRQMYDLWKNLDKELICTADQLYNDIKKLGYNWDELLETRGWWTLEGVSNIPFLSSMDILKMRIGAYIPFWMANPPAAAVEARKRYNDSKSSLPAMLTPSTDLILPAQA